MQVKPEQLSRQLDAGLARCYLVTGDEPLLVQESADAIRAAARAAGCDERERIDTTTPAGWQDLLQSGGALSLFAQRKLVEVHVPSGKPGTEGSKALQAYLDREGDDVLLIIAGKIDKSSRRGKWFNALDQAGVVVTVWPVSPQEMPRWLQGRLQQAGLRADREALQLLSERVEGNLLAAMQEVEKLKLLADSNDITAQTVIECVFDNARYSVFGLIDKALAGDARGALRTLRGLRAEATAPPVLLWAINREVKLLAEITDDIARGTAAHSAMNQRGVWRNRTALVQQGLDRHTPSSIAELQSGCFAVDASTKGFGPGDPWDHLETVIVQLALGDSSSNSRRRA
ncbi:DNA polymerase III, delta subunit [Luminiphilus syltensis NOR5-1B]|uniref:DNA polymerase III subunit delta n=1 Tax=Luminiphilus syltensis NOR5-1B TaxID=565045 RepID=B8KRV8_9GAMM|nr:DNA polymerase III subunit delta [Luminiphilus syltensis]EED36630.1 DNA polymerase III, delta subunit [Luminiphilus syltensis NOR5-1B]